MNATEKQLNELLLRSLDRLVATKRLKFRDAFCVIFSDYPSTVQLHGLLMVCDMPLALRDRMTEEYQSMKNKVA